jgi:two-component system phosphate regulon sensor histidine kinase PhoR
VRVNPFLRLLLFGLCLLLFNLALCFLLEYGQARGILEAGGWMERPEGLNLLARVKSSFLWSLLGVGALGAMFVWVMAKRWSRDQEGSSLTEEDWRRFGEAKLGRPVVTSAGPKDIYIPGRNYSELVGRLGDQDSLLLTVIRSMNEGVLLLNEADRIVLLNPSAQRVLGVSEEAALGRHYLEVVRHAGLADLIGLSKNQDIVAQGELELADKEDRSFHVNVGAVREPGGRVLGQVVVLGDITALKHLMRMRSDFVANVSHELKTPLTAIMGYVETLQAGAMEDKKNRGQFLEKIGDQSRRLKALIEDVLELSRIESGRYVEPVSVVALKEAVETAKELLRAKADAKRIRLLDETPEDLRVKAQNDGLQRILLNLLDNAIKYSPEDTVVTVTAREDGAGGVELRVTDEGCGIPEEHQARVFERFYRVDVSRSRAAGGTGLGLAIVKHLAERVGGSVSLRSAGGEGSTFTVTLPQA